MNTKEFLSQAYGLNEIINSNLRELEEIRALSTSITTLKTETKVKTSTISDITSNVVAKIVDYEREINKEIDKFIDIKKELRQIISIVEKPNERLLLRLRYLEFLTWEQVAEKMSYSLKQIYRIHIKAIESVEKLR